MKTEERLVIAYLLWFFLGYLGFHRFYLGRTGTGLTMLMLSLVGSALWYTVIGIPFAMLLGLIVGVWWFIDALRIPSFCATHNQPED